MENQKTTPSKVSQLAENIIGSEIIKLAGEVKALIAKGKKIHNLTIGDFNPEQFPIPQGLKDEIIKAYNDNQTNYPPANGIEALRKEISHLLKTRGNIDYSPDEILVMGGARPIIYSVYSAIVDPGDTVVYTVPSWNNNHYSYLHQAKSFVVEGKVENNFMPTAEDIRPAIKEASLIALCSPQNPTGTVFSNEGLAAICDLILEENKRRGADKKPVYLLFDQIYWELTMDGTEHHNPVVLRPEMKEYTLFIDGVSKSLSATGVRVGWGFGPKSIMDKIKSINSHVGAWAAKAEQTALANFLSEKTQYVDFIEGQRERIYARLKGLYDGFQTLKSEGYNVDAISPQAAIYLTIKFDLKGKTTADGTVLSNTKEITRYILNEGKLAVVPFYAFGTAHDSPWYRLSVGTCGLSDIEDIIHNLREALSQLK